MNATGDTLHFFFESDEPNPGLPRTFPPGPELVEVRDTERRLEQILLTDPPDASPPEPD